MAKKMVSMRMRYQDMGARQKIADVAEKGQYALDNTVLRDSNSYAPMDQGDLIESGIRHSRLGEGQIIWSTPYARRLYYNPQYNFSTDRNPQAQGLWFEAAKSQHLRDWINAIEQAIRGGL